MIGSLVSRRLFPTHSTMADTMRPPSLLPCIRCSSCHAEIPIAAMGEHVCTGPSNQPTPAPLSWKSKLFASSTKPATSSSRPSTSSSSSNSGAAPQMRIKPIAATGPPLSRSGLPSPSRTQKAARTVTAATGREGGRITPTPAEPTDDAHRNPSVASSNGAESVVRRLDSIAPGPFAVGDPAKTRNSTASARTSTTTDSAEERGRLKTSHEPRGNGQIQFQSPFFGARNGPPRGYPTSRSPSPAQWAPGRSGAGDGSSSSSSRRHEHSSAAASERQQARAGSVPLKTPAHTAPALNRRPTEPAPGLRPVSPLGHAGRRPSASDALRVAAVENQKLFSRPDHHHEHRHHSSSAGLSASDASSNSGSSPRPDYRYHTPTESMSSNGSSYASDIRTASSVSTPPLSGSPERVAQKLAAATAASTAPLGGLKLNVHAATQHVEGESGSSKPDGGYRERPSISGVERARFADATVLSPQTYVSEASFARRGGAGSSSGQAAKSTARGMSGSTASDSRRPSEAPDSRRPSTKTSRGPCRGCGEDIVGGKSVSSADGRLTGRYHKQCFVCTSCQESFTTSEFYVLNDQPYCERHYHILNNSLCQACDRGIEGQYLETDRLQRFHPDCLKCHDCQVVLRHDYFELNGRVYCDADAMRLARQASVSASSTSASTSTTTTMAAPGGLAVGGGGSGSGGVRTNKHPERRTTRLLQMN